MVKEYVEKGERIPIDKAVISNDDIISEISYPNAERLLINQKILKNISLLNHSCAAMGLLDREVNRELEKRFELRAVRDILKEEEVEIFYPIENALPWLHDDMRKTIQEDFGFDCKCPMCSGEVPNHDDTMRKIMDVLNSNRIKSKDEKDMTLLDWTRDATAFGAIVELAKPVYMRRGREELKMAMLMYFLKAAIEYDQPSLNEKAVDGIKEMTEKFGLEVFK